MTGPATGYHREGRPMSTRLMRGGAAFAFLTAVAGLAAVPTHGRPPAERANDPLVPKSERDLVVGVANCKQCHLQPVPNSDFVVKTKSNTFVRLNESTTWAEEDPHSRAYSVLEGDLGKQMSKVLGYEVTKAAQCLACHATETTTAGAKEKTFDTSVGVACNTCHGLRRGWQQEHFIDVADGKGGRVIEWRTFHPAKKEEFGLRNLRDPVVKAQFCSTCHVGSPAEGRVVTHEMYAAGHPPLPPFELATFMQCQPKHWGYPTEPSLEFFAKFGGTPFKADKPVPNWQWELYRFHPEKEEVYLARQLASGAIASLQAEMAQLAADAKAPHGGIDFARFDCYACHHDLKYPSDRQKRGYNWAPGRPTPKAWTAALPGVVAEHAKGLPKYTGLAGEFAALWQKVEKAATARPFGDAPELATAAGAMADWCGKFLAAQGADAAPIYTPQEAVRLREAIAKAAQSDRWSADSEAAMHLTWGYLALRGDKGQESDKLRRLGEVLPTMVRYPPYKNPNGEPASVGERLEKRADLFRRYDAKTFLDAFRGLSK
jgi:hypothetical protein